MVCECSSKAVALLVSIAHYTCATRCHCVHTWPAPPLRSLDGHVYLMLKYHGMCGTRLDAECIWDAGARGWRGRIRLRTELTWLANCMRRILAKLMMAVAVEWRAKVCRGPLAVFDRCKSMMEVATLTN